MTWKTRTPAVRILASFWGMLGGMSTATVQRIRRRHDSRSAAGRAADERAATLHLLHGPRGDCFELCIFRVAGVCGVCRHDAAPPARWGFKTRWVLRAPSTDRPYEALAWARAHYSRLALREARRKMRQPWAMIETKHHCRASVCARCLATALIRHCSTRLRASCGAAPIRAGCVRTYLMPASRAPVGLCAKSERRSKRENRGHETEAADSNTNQQWWEFSLSVFGGPIVARPRPSRTSHDV